MPRPKKTEAIVTGGVEPLYGRIQAILAEARSQAWRAVNSAMVAAYWEIGRVIVEEERNGRTRAEYGERLLEGLSELLKKEFGRGFDRTNLHRMKLFYLTYPIRDAVRHELGWTHYRLLLKVERDDARGFYEAEAVAARWSTRELERQIDSLLFERLALSRDKKKVLALAKKGHEIEQPTDLLKDPYVLEFACL